MRQPCRWFSVSLVKKPFCLWSNCITIKTKIQHENSFTSAVRNALHAGSSTCRREVTDQCQKKTKAGFKTLSSNISSSINSIQTGSLLGSVTLWKMEWSLVLTKKKQEKVLQTVKVRIWGLSVCWLQDSGKLQTLFYTNAFMMNIRKKKLFNVGVDRHLFSWKQSLLFNNNIALFLVLKALELI